MNNRLNPIDCQSAFEELYRSSPVPIVVRSACNTSLTSFNKFVFKSPQPLCHTQLISPRPLVTSTSGPKLDPKSQVFESLKKTNDGKSEGLLNGFGKEKNRKEQAMTEGGEGDTTNVPVHEKTGQQGKQSKPMQPDTSTADHRNAAGDSTAGSAKTSSLQEEEDDEDHFIDNFFSKKSPKDIESVIHAEDREGEECQDADIEDGSDITSQDDEEPHGTRGQRQSRTQGSVDAPTKLYDWIVKPVAKAPNMKGICLDGKRDKSIDEYWQTGMVTMRQSSTVVATASGSRYHLIGPMDLYEAVEAGMSPEVAKKFKRGFPVNWIHVLEEFFASLDKEEEGSTMEEELPPSQKSSKLTRPGSVSSFRQHDQYHLDSADSQTDTQQKQKEKGKKTLQAKRKNARSCDAKNKYASKTESSGNSQKGEESSDDIFRPVDRCDTEESSTNQQPVKDKVTKLHLWIIKPVQNRLGICLEGQRDREDEYWHSSVITQRLDQKRVVTNSGSVYQLVGPIQKLDALEAGIPEKIVKAFQNGFPKNWKKLLNKYYGDTELESESDTSVATTTTTSSLQPQQQSHKKSRSKKTRAKKEETADEESVDLDNTLCTPQGQLVNLDHVPRTRSGRRVMPQLAWWVGQRRTYDGQGNVMEITYGTPHAESFVKQSYTDLKTRSFSVRKYTPNTSSVSASRKKLRDDKDINVEREVLSVIDKQKQERMSKTNTNKETCYSKDKRRSKLDMIPVVPLTVMKGKNPSSMSETSDGEDNKQKRNRQRNCENKGNSASETSDIFQEKKQGQAKKKTTSRRRIVTVATSSSEDEGDEQEYKPKSNVKSKRKPQKSGKLDLTKKRKSAESSSEPEVVKKKARTRKIIDSGDDTCTSQSEETRTKKQTKHQKAKAASETKKIEKCEWGKAEIKRLYKAIERTSEHHPHFWDVVAESVETRSPDECRIFHEKNADKHKPPEKKAKPKKKGKPKSKKGIPEEDDLFQATPYRPSDSKKPKTFNLTADETMNFEDSCMPTPGALHKTPIVRDIQSLRLEKSLLYKSKLEMQSAESSDDTRNRPIVTGKTKAKSSGNNNGIGLTAGKGTLKRKEQLREIYEKHNEGEEDDLFDATPVRQQNHKKKVPQMFTLTEEEELEFESGCIPTPGSRHKTPIVRETQSSRFNKTPKSSAKTVTTPWLSNVNRKTTDQVIAQNQRQGAKQKKTKVTKESRTPRTSKKMGPTKSLFRNDTTLTNLFEEVDVADEDDEEEKDYYWSDED